MGPVTTIVITDPELLAKLAAANGQIRISDGERPPYTDC
jgi:hypothetical protein